MHLAFHVNIYYIIINWKDILICELIIILRNINYCFMINEINFYNK